MSPTSTDAVSFAPLLLDAWETRIGRALTQGGVAANDLTDTDLQEMVDEKKRQMDACTNIWSLYGTLLGHN